jgi:hypothetical protein
MRALMRSLRLSARPLVDNRFEYSACHADLAGQDQAGSTKRARNGTAILMISRLKADLNPASATPRFAATRLTSAFSRDAGSHAVNGSLCQVSERTF